MDIFTAGGVLGAMAPAGERVAQLVDDQREQRDQEWRRGRLAELDGTVLGFDDWQPDAAKEHKLRAVNRDFLQIHGPEGLDLYEPESYEAFRDAAARQLFGGAGAGSDEGFFGEVRKRAQGRADDAKLREELAGAGAGAAISSRPLAEVLAEGKAKAGDRWAEFEPAVRAGHAAVLAAYGEDELKSARILFELLAKREGAAVEQRVERKPIEGEPLAELGAELRVRDEMLATYGRADQAGRERILALVGMMAEAEGEEIEGFFSRAAAAWGAGNSRLATGGNGAMGRLLMWASGDSSEKWKEDAPEIVGATYLPSDLQNAGVRVRKYLDEEREGFWDRVGDYSVMAVESGPYMLAASVPSGWGYLVSGYAEDNRAELRRTAPELEDWRAEAIAYGAGTIEAGVDRLQFVTLGARLPKLKAAVYRWGKPGIAATFLGRVGTVAAAETAQEVIQDLTFPAVQELAGALSEDVPDVDWQEVFEREREALGDIAGVSLIFGIFGGMGSTAGDYFSQDAMREALSDRKALALSGLPDEAVEAVASEAESNPLAAAETLKAAMIETPAEARRAYAERAEELQRREAEEIEFEKARAWLPEIERDEDGGLVVVYPDGRRDEAESEEDAQAAVRTWEMDETASMQEANRELARFIQDSHEGSAEVLAQVRFTGRDATLADWAKESAERLEVARARVRIAMRQAGDPLADVMADEDLPLAAFVILGDSRNFGGAVTRIAMQIHNRGNVATVIEEHAEGVAKWAMESGRMPREELLRNLRELERATGRETIGDAATDQELVEGFSRMAVANFFGKAPETRGLSAKFKAILRAFAEAFSAVLELAAGIRKASLEGKINEDFEELLDIAGGVSTAYRKANLDAEMERELHAAAFEGLPEVSEQLRGKLPHPETLRASGNPLAGEVARIYEAVRNSAGSKAAGTRKANDYFLPAGEDVDLDNVREAINSGGGFGFDTPAEMLDALDLSLNYGKPQYGADAGVSFSIERMAGDELPLIHGNHSAGRTEGQQGGSGVLSPEIAGALERFERERAEGRDPKLFGFGSESFVFRLTPDQVIKAFRDDGAWTYARAGGLVRSREAAALRAKVEVIRALDGMPTSLIAGGGESFLIQDQGRPVTQSEYEAIAFANGLKPSEHQSFRLVIDGREYLVGDLVRENFLKDDAGVIRLADPVAGEVDPGAGFLADGSDSSLAIERTDSPLLAAIEAQAKAPERKAAVYAKMKVKVLEVRARYDKRRWSAPITADEMEHGAARLEMLRDLATLEAVARSMPPEIRGKLVGSFRKVESLKTAKAREKYLAGLLPRIESALERHLVGLYSAGIRRVLEKGAPKVAESKTRGGKIGAKAHAIFAEAKRAMVLTPAEAEARVEELTARIEGADELTLDELDEADGQRAVVELLHDYENADSARLEQALDLLGDLYKEGRQMWLEVLAGRKQERAERVAQIVAGLGYVPGEEAQGAAQRADEGMLKSTSEGLMAAVLSGSQTIRRLGEATKDPTVKAAVEEMEKAFQDAEAGELDLNLADNRELGKALRQILGVKTEYGLTKALRELSTSDGKNVPVTIVEGRKKVEISVPIKFAESLLNGEASGFDTRAGERVELNLAQKRELEKQLERLEALPDDERARRQVVKVVTTEATGKRNTIGARTQMEALGLYLTMRQADQREKLEGMGYDDTTWQELEAWLKPETKALGAWMTAQLAADQGAIDKLHRDEKGVGLALVDNYFPVRNRVSRADTGGLSLDGGQPQQGGRSVSFIKERVTNQAKPAYLNALAVFLGHRQQQNFWRSHVAAMREWGGVIRDQRFFEAVTATMGQKYYNALTRRLERIESGGKLAGERALAYEKILQGTLRRFALGTLGLRVSTLMVNASAALNVLTEHDGKRVLKGMVQALKRPEAFRDAWKSPAIRRRLEAGATFEAQLALGGGPSMRPVVKQLESWAEKGVAPINYVDTGANLLGAAAVWELTRTDALRANVDQVAARKLADEAVERFFQRAAQPASRLARSEMEMKMMGNPLGAMFALFASEPRKNLAIAYMAVRELATGKGYQGKKQAAQSAVVTLLGMVAMEYALRSLYSAIFQAGEDDEDEVFARWWGRMTDGKAWAHRIAVGHLTGIPGVGKVWEAFAGHLVNSADFVPGDEVRVFDSSPDPMMRLTGDMKKGIGGLTSGEAELQDAIDTVQAFGSAVPGGPLFSQIANLVEAIEGAVDSNK